MKKYLFLTATAALAMASCSSDNYIGEDPASAAGEVAISFDGGTGVITRADKNGAEAATALGNNFVVYGWKTTSSGEQVVFDHYNVNYVTGTGTSTVTNVNGWEYVNQDRNLKGSSPAKKLGNLADDATQEIKYWDFAATKYDFVAFSLGQGVTVTPPTTTYAQVYTSDTDPISYGVNRASLTTNAYQLIGSADELAACYIADKVTVDDQASHKSQSVQFKFRSLGSKVRVGLYETIPGFAVSSVEFYPSASGSAQANATLFTKEAAKLIPAGDGKMTVTFPHPTETTNLDYNKVHATFTPDGDTKVASKVFGALTMSETAQKKEYKSSYYLGRTSSTATIADAANDNGYEVVLPNEAGIANGLNLKIKFTLEAIDGSGETIVIDGATATVPQEFTQWKPNYAYTYIFKISEKVSGAGGELLYPITLDAVVVDDEAGVQQTITDFNTPSITTYAKGAVNDEYYQDDHIYVKVPGTTLSTTNTKLYTAEVEAGAAQQVTEAAVENCLANYTGVTISSAAPSAVTGLTVGTSDVSSYYTLDNGVYYKCAASAKAETSVNYYNLSSATINGYVVKDANGKKLTVTESTATMSVATEIAAADAPDGNAIAGNFMKFTPGAGGNFVFMYDDSSKKHFKVIKVTGSNRPTN